VGRTIDTATLIQISDAAAVAVIILIIALAAIMARKRR